MPGAARRQPISFEEYDITPAGQAEVVRHATSNDAPANDDDAGAIGQIGITSRWLRHQVVRAKILGGTAPGH